MKYIEVYDALGRKLYEHKADSPQRHELSLSGVASGIYTIRIATDNGNLIRKLEIIK